MDLQIKPYVGVGQILFGTSLSDAARLLGSDYQTINSFKTHPLARYLFPRCGVFLEVCQPGVVVAVEMCAPANPVFQGVKLLATPFDDLRAFFAKSDSMLVVDPSGLRSEVFGISLYAPDHSSAPDIVPEGAGAFEQGYWTKYYTKTQ